MYHAFKPLNEYPYRYAPPIDVVEARVPRYSLETRMLTPNAAAVRYNPGGFNPGVSVSSYARPKDLSVLSLQPFDLAVPGIEPLPVDATLPTVRPEIYADDEDFDLFDDDDWDGYPPPRTAGSRAIRRLSGPYARPGAARRIDYGGSYNEAPPYAQPAPAPVQPAPAVEATAKVDATVKMIAVGLAGFLGGVVLGSVLSRRP